MKSSHADPAEQPDLLKLIALVSHQDVHHTLVQENGVEVVVSEEDGQLIGAQAFPQRCQAVVRQLAGAALQKVLQAWAQSCKLSFCWSEYAVSRTHMTWATVVSFKSVTSVSLPSLYT